MASPTLSGLDTATFNENTVNATPQVIDSAVAFDDVDGDFDGGTLTVSGLLAEDTVSILSGSVISLSGGVVYYDADGVGGAAAVAFGTVTGGVGATFTVTFSADATSAAIDALIQNLTYANSSDTPTASRTLVLDVVDAGGNHLAGAASFAIAIGVANPFNGIDVGIDASPTLIDVDGDGDLDMVVGEGFGSLVTYRNGTDGTAGAFSVLAGLSNPFNGLDVGYFATPKAVDLDGDGDQDLIVGTNDGVFLAFRNGSNGAPGAFTQLLGGDNPLNGLDAGTRVSPAFADLDGDGDLDMVVGETNGTLLTYRNGTNGAAGAEVAPVLHTGWRLG